MSAFTIQTAAPLHLQIAEHLERRITGGELRDGERLPNTVELAAEYGVTPVTVQKSLQRLVELDLLERAPRRGTFVKPHQTANTVGLVFGYNPFRVQSMLYLRLLELFRSQAEAGKINLKVYFDTQENGSSRALYEMRRDVASGKLKALIAIDRSPELSDWLNQQQEIFWIEPLHTDSYRAVKTSIEYLLSRGYRRILMVSMQPVELLYGDWAVYFQQEKAAMEAVVAGHDATAEIVRWGQSEIDGYREGKALFGDSSRPRPDAIFVNHDVVCRGLLLALMEQGLKIPQDVALLTHANLGCEFASPVPLTRIAFDPAEMVANCLRLLDTVPALQPGGHASSETVRFQLIPGKSCGE